MAPEVARLDELDVFGWLVEPTDPGAHLRILERPGFAVPIPGGGISVPVGYPPGLELSAELIGIGRGAGYEGDDLDLPDPRAVADVLHESDDRYPSPGSVSLPGRPCDA